MARYSVDIIGKRLQHVGYDCAQMLGPLADDIDGPHSLVRSWAPFPIGAAARR